MWPRTSIHGPDGITLERSLTGRKAARLPTYRTALPRQALRSHRRSKVRRCSRGAERDDEGVGAKIGDEVVRDDEDRPAGRLAHRQLDLRILIVDPSTAVVITNKRFTRQQISDDQVRVHCR